MTTLPTPLPAPSAEGVEGLDPTAVLKGIGTLRRLVGIYPDGHPMVRQRLEELDEAVRALLRRRAPVRIDIVDDEVHVDGESFPVDPAASGLVVQDLLALGVHSIQLSVGIDAEELRALARFLWEMKQGIAADSVEAQLVARGVRHVRLGRLVPLDTRWQGHQWPDAPSGELNPDYAESLLRAKHTFDEVAAGRDLKPAAMRDFVQLLVYKVARSNGVLGQVLSVKQYENLTYCHSVNVAMLSLLLGRRVGLDEQALAILVEAALLHDIGKTRIPLEVIQKPGALDQHERRLMESHTTSGAEILLRMPGLHPLTPHIALEHHRTVRGYGYPNLGDGVVPHPMSQIVSVADIYEAVTGARTYRAPSPPERACLLLARLAGDTLDTALVKAFVNAISFFPIGSVVRTSEERLGVVVRTTDGDPLHPVIIPVDDRLERDGDEIDTSRRDEHGAYRCHVLESVRPAVDTFDVRAFLEPAAA
jgi:putative nucleotidyltransferase with HDIG domain